MKICFLTHNIFTLGGVQRVVSVLANELSNNHSVEIICMDRNAKIDRNIYDLNEKINVKISNEIYNKKNVEKIISKIGIMINNKFNIFKNTKYLGTYINVFFPRKMRSRLGEYLNKEEFDIVIGVEGIYSILLGSISDIIKAKTIGWQHNSYEAYFNNKNQYCWNLQELFKYYILKLDKYIVLTEYDKTMYLKEMNINTVVIHNPKSFISNVKSTVTQNQFLAAGRFTTQKGFDYLIESFRIFSEMDEKWKLVIVGEGQDEKKIRDLIEKYRLNNRVIINPFTDNIKNYFLESSVLLLPSRWEGMPMIVLEALEMGVPIISYDITASQELIDNKINGILVNKFNVEMFANAMLEMSNSYDLRKKMSLQCIEEAKKYNIHNIADIWETIFNGI